MCGFVSFEGVAFLGSISKLYFCVLELVGVLDYYLLLIGFQVSSGSIRSVAKSKGFGFHHALRLDLLFAMLAIHAQVAQVHRHR